MVSLEGTRTDANLKHAFSDEGRYDRLYLAHQQTAEAAGYHDLASLSRAAANSGACYARGHLDYLVAGNSSVIPSRTSAVELAGAMTGMIDEHTAMYAAMARTAHDEGFEEIADWFETLARSRRSQAGRMRRALKKCQIKS